MNASFIVTITGVHPKAMAGVEKMLREEIVTYPSRVSMDGATVERVVKKHEPVTREAARRAVRAVREAKGNGES